MATANLRRGYVLGLTAYVIWGLFPLYFKLLERIPAVEIIVQRAVWSALFGAVLLLFWKHPGWWRELRQNPQRFVVLAASGLLIASNWMTYVWAVNNGHMLEASLGYYINPLINVMLGMLLLKERLRPLQWLAVALASLGVAQQVWQLGSLPWVSLVLALTFGFYGLIRKGAGRRAARTGGGNLAAAAAGAGLVAVFRRRADQRNGFLEHPGSPVGGRRGPGDAGSAGLLQRCGKAPALRHPGLPAIPGADAGPATGDPAVRRASGLQPPDRLRFHLARPGRLQLRRLAQPAPPSPAGLTLSPGLRNSASLAKNTHSFLSPANTDAQRSTPGFSTGSCTHFVHIPAFSSPQARG